MRPGDWQIADQFNRPEEKVWMCIHCRERFTRDKQGSDTKYLHLKTKHSEVVRKLLKRRKEPAFVRRMSPDAVLTNILEASKETAKRLKEDGFEVEASNMADNQQNTGNMKPAAWNAFRMSDNPKRYTDQPFALVINEQQNESDEEIDVVGLQEQPQESDYFVTTADHFLPRECPTPPAYENSENVPKLYEMIEQGDLLLVRIGGKEIVVKHPKARHYFICLNRLITFTSTLIGRLAFDQRAIAQILYPVRYEGKGTRIEDLAAALESMENANPLKSAKKMVETVQDHIHSTSGKDRLVVLEYFQCLSNVATFRRSNYLTNGLVKNLLTTCKNAYGDAL